MPYPTCNFIMYDGVLCGSPALHGRTYCYHHTRQMISACYGARAHRRRYELRLDLPLLEDRRAIQHMLSQVVGALGANTIHYRRAAAIVTALRLALSELNRAEEW
jgi:hypothetical protein